MGKQFFKTTIFFLLLFLAAASGKTQTAIDSARNILTGFYQTYDSLHYLTFDIRYTFSSDTVYGDFTYEVMSGNYTMNGNKAKYSLGDVEYLMNDSFYITVYHNDESIVVSNPPVRNAGSFLPMREVIDSLLQSYSAHYDFSIIDTSTSVGPVDAGGYIKLTRKQNDTVAQFNHYTIEFPINSPYISAVEYEFTEPGQTLTAAEEPDSAIRLLKSYPRRRTLRIEFSNYHFENFSDQLYSENNFIWQEDGEYKPVDKYKNYTVYNARK